jgi:hypothetical protein
MTLEEAKSLMTPEALNKLKDVVSERPQINMGNKANNDILMAALCKAVEDGVILPESLSEKTIKLLNAKTNTLSPKKLGSILKEIRESQPNIVCCISLIKPIDATIQTWIFKDKNVDFLDIFVFIIEYFKLTPNQVRTEMCKFLKPTIVNNIAQLVAKYQYGDENDKKDINVSITTLTRLANMCKHMLLAEFKRIH